jgi:hypothetical protein
MNINPIIRDNVLPYGLFATARIEAFEAAYGDVPLGRGVKMHAAKVPDWLVKTLVSEVEHTAEMELELLDSCFRVNSYWTDKGFRIHSDGLINGQVCDMAAVFYINDHESGTALFSHPSHGEFERGGGKRVFEVDDGRWRMTFKAEAVANRLFIYDGCYYHQRHPAKCDTDRLILVLFFNRKRYES